MASNAKTRTAEQDVQAQIQELRDDIAKLTSSIGALGAERVERTRSKASDSYEQAIAEGEKALKELQSKAKSLEDDLTDHVRQKPLQTLALAAGLGFMVALLTRR